MKKFTPIFGLLALTIIGGTAYACSPNLPNYGNCVRMRQEAQRQIQQQAYMHTKNKVIKSPRLSMNLWI